MQQCVASLVSIALQISRARWVLALLFLATLVVAGSLSAQAQDDPGPRSIFSEVRLGLFGHHVEPAGSEKGGQDINLEVLFSRPAVAYGSHLADIALRPRLHVGASINVNGDTSQLYSGLTWNIPLMERVTLELTFGGSLHDGQHDGKGSAFGCSLNFREFGIDRDCSHATLAPLRHRGAHVECRPVRAQQRSHQRRPSPGLCVRLKIPCAGSASGPDGPPQAGGSQHRWPVTARHRIPIVPLA